MLLETQRLTIRDVKPEDEAPFVEMASDGSLQDIGFDKDCGRWLGKWIVEAKEFALRDTPDTDYLAYMVTLKEECKAVGSVGCSYYEDLGEIGITYFIGAQYRKHGYAAEAVKAYTEYFFKHYDVQKLIATVRAENAPSWKAVEKAGFKLTEKKLYKDMNDEKEELYHFYEITK